MPSICVPGDSRSWKLTIYSIILISWFSLQPTQGSLPVLATHHPQWQQFSRWEGGIFPEIHGKWAYFCWGGEENSRCSRTLSRDFRGVSLGRSCFLHMCPIPNSLQVQMARRRRKDGVCIWATHSSSHLVGVGEKRQKDTVSRCDLQMSLWPGNKSFHGTVQWFSCF